MLSSRIISCRPDVSYFINNRTGMSVTNDILKYFDFDFYVCLLTHPVFWGRGIEVIKRSVLLNRKETGPHRDGICLTICFTCKTYHINYDNYGNRSIQMDYHHRSRRLTRLRLIIVECLRKKSTLGGNRWTHLGGDLLRTLQNKRKVPIG